MGELDSMCIIYNVIIFCYYIFKSLQRHDNQKYIQGSEWVLVYSKIVQSSPLSNSQIFSSSPNKTASVRGRLGGGGVEQKG